MNERCIITVDGMPVEAARGSALLDALRALDIPIPTLCHHSSLEPSGACRLCVVEVTHPDWQGGSQLVTSCLYPAAPGLVVSTRSPRVVETRRTILEMLLARCPDAEALRALARAEGVDTSAFPGAVKTDKCVLCGLCVRVCQDLGPGALAMLDRGPERLVGPRPDAYGEDCVGCGACSWICPTGEIVLNRTPGALRVWGRDFALPVASVRESFCRACGLCEAVCPVLIPRVALRADGTAAALIAPDFCWGCGLCAGACPTGAIEQEAFPMAVALAERLDRGAAASMSDGRTLAGRAPVFACARSAFPTGTADHYRVPCVGQITVEGLLECLARGADGALVMGRDKATCLYGPGEDRAQERVEVANAVAQMAGLGAERLRFAVPPQGQDGPVAALEEFRAACAPSPPASALQPTARLDGATGLDRAVALWRWLAERQGASPQLPADLAALFKSEGQGGAADADTLLYLGEWPVLDKLAGLLVPASALREVFEAAASLLREHGIACRPVMTLREVRESRARRMITLCAGCAPDFGRPLAITSLDELAGLPEAHGLPAARGPRAISDAPATGCAPFRFDIGPEKRRDLVERLRREREPLCHCPGEFLQLVLAGREGAWRSGPAGHPVLAFVAALSAASDKERP